MKRACRETNPLNLSPFYEEITSRAIELLNSAAVNGNSLDELRSWGDCWELRNEVGVALCMARDELEARLTAEGKRNVRRKVRFSSNHKMAEDEIARMILRRVLPKPRCHLRLVTSEGLLIPA